MKPRIILTTLPSLNEAKTFAETFLERKLVACVSLLPQMISLYWWKEEIQEANEVLLLMKTTEDHVETILREGPSVHPYETPEFLVLKPKEIGEAYSSWLQHTVHAEYQP